MSRILNLQKEAVIQLRTRRLKAEEPAYKILHFKKSEEPREAVQGPQDTLDIQGEGSPRNKAGYLPSLILGILVLFSVSLNIGLFLMLRNYSLVQAAMLKNVEDIKKSQQHSESQVGDLSAKITGLLTDFQGIDLKLAESRAGMREIAGISEAQKASIENVTKAKDRLFTRVSNIEAELEKIKEAVQPSSSATISSDN